MVKILEWKEFLDLNALRDCVNEYPRLKVHEYTYEKVFRRVTSALQELCIFVKFPQFYMQMIENLPDDESDTEKLTQFTWREEFSVVDDDLAVLQRIARFYAIEELTWQMDAFTSNRTIVLGTLDAFQHLTSLTLHFNCTEIGYVPALVLPLLENLHMTNNSKCTHIHNHCAVTRLMMSIIGAHYVNLEVPALDSTIESLPRNDRVRFNRECLRPLAKVDLWKPNGVVGCDLFVVTDKIAGLGNKMKRILWSLRAMGCMQSIIIRVGRARIAHIIFFVRLADIVDENISVIEIVESLYRAERCIVHGKCSSHCVNVFNPLLQPPYNQHSDVIDIVLFMEGKSCLEFHKNFYYRLHEIYLR